jgi:hypothetical protein
MINTKSTTRTRPNRKYAHTCFSIREPSLSVVKFDVVVRIKFTAEALRRREEHVEIRKFSLCLCVSAVKYFY